ncbi:MAG: hypothetical protein LBL37_04085 [Gracilibacteraceae bacterium]|jgi:hypothetical protein|nr:hypothetical protein [Gracilibacteraceae bacterium]
MNKDRNSSPARVRFLHVIHLLTVTLWLGGVACVFALTIRAFGLDAAGFTQAASLVLWIFPHFLLPVAVASLLEGLYYGFLTKWGFFRHKWLLVKWLLFLANGPLIGAGCIGQMQAALARAQSGAYIGGLADGGGVLLALAGHIALLTVMYILSVYKPGKAGRRKQFETV